MHRNRRPTGWLAAACLALGTPGSALAQRAVPVAVQGTSDVQVVNGSQQEVPVAVSREAPIAFSGEWAASGLVFPSMIAHDIIFYAANDNGNANCQFSMNFVINQITSRTIRRFTLVEGGSVELHYEAGIDTSHLRFGTIGSACLRHYVVMGFPTP
ncbi:MAG: hypothetical protein R3F35_24695 [Myxococcota bacterium]